MRLVCPNCEAKYEVPDDAIPDTGRDVQCAACNHAWYQMRPRAAVTETAAPVAPPVAAPPAPVAEEPEPLPETPAEAPAEVASDTTAPEPAAEPEAETSAPAEPEADADAAPAPAETAVEPDPEPEAPAAPAPAPAPAYAVDDSVLAILREEAEREAAARRADARPLEIQTDLGIETAPAIALAAAAPAAAADPVATPEAAEPAAEPVAEPVAVVAEEKPAPRRDLLPDVEEINSTLRPSEAASESDFADDAAVVRQRGFRGGFLTVMVAAMIAVALYVGAPTLSRLVPALEQPLTSYVAMGNDLRLSLDRLMQSATDALNGE